MEIEKLLQDKSIKATEKRAIIVDALQQGSLMLSEIAALPLDDKKTAIILEAMEALTRKNPAIATVDWLHFATRNIASISNSVKREASRVVGNIASLYPDDLGCAIPLLLDNTHHEGTVVRWGSAYALGRIVAIPPYATNDLYAAITALSEQETENGVKNQYLAGLKKANKYRK